MRSRSSVSTSNRALLSCPDVKGEGDTHVERYVGLQVCKLERCCHHMLYFEVGDGFDVLVQVHVADPEVPVRLALPRPVAHLLGNHHWRLQRRWATGWGRARRTRISGARISRRGTMRRLSSTGNAYRSLGDFSQAIKYHTQDHAARGT